MTQNKVFVLGATGSVGTYAVTHLLSKNIPVTIYSRDIHKAKAQFKAYDTDLLTVVQGDFTDLSAFQRGIQGHDRLIMILAFSKDTSGLQPVLAKHAYDAGVQQIIYLSTNQLDHGFRGGYIANEHYEAEEGIRAIPNRGYFVSLRPGYFMSNLLHFTRPDPQGVLRLTFERDEVRGFISPKDIGEMAATIACEDIEKHENMVYSLLGEISTFGRLVETLSEVTGKKFSYEPVSPVEMYNQFIRFVPHVLALDFADNLKADTNPRLSHSIEIVLGRKPHSLREFMTEHKEALSQLIA